MVVAVWARGGTPEQACIIKTGQAANQSPAIRFKELARGATTSKGLERRVALCPFIYGPANGTLVQRANRNMRKTTNVWAVTLSLTNL